MIAYKQYSIRHCDNRIENRIRAFIILVNKVAR